VEIGPAIIAAVVDQLARGIETSRLSCAAVSSCLVEADAWCVGGVEFARCGACAVGRIVLGCYRTFTHLCGIVDGRVVVVRGADSFALEVGNLCGSLATSR